jgi:hypothetical protein
MSDEKNKRFGDQFREDFQKLGLTPEEIRAVSEALLQDSMATPKGRASLFRSASARIAQHVENPQEVGWTDEFSEMAKPYANEPEVATYLAWVQRAQAIKKG